LFGTNRRDGQKTEIVLSITPRLVGSMNMPDARLVDFWSGTEATLRSEQLTLRPAGSIAMSSGAGAGGVQKPEAKPPAANVRGRTPPPILPGGGAQTPPAPASLPMSFTWQGPVQAKVGDKFTVTLNTQSAAEVRNLGVIVSYDPALLKAVDAVEGTFAKQGGAGANFTREIDLANGQISVGVASAGEQGAKGAGSLAAITFEVVAAGASQIGVASVTPSGAAGEAVNFVVPAAHSMTFAP
jgi:general secretion pathway protein D